MCSRITFLLITTFLISLIPTNVPVLGQQNKAIEEKVFPIRNKIAPMTSGLKMSKPQSGSQISEDFDHNSVLKKKQEEKLQEEIYKLRAEIESLEALPKETRLWTTWVGAVGGLAGTLLAAGAAFLGWNLRKSFAKVQEDKMKQDKELTQEKHFLELCQSLGNENPRIQISAAAVLISRLKTNFEKGDEAKNGNTPDMFTSQDYEERNSIIKVLLSITKEREGRMNSGNK